MPGRSQVRFAERMMAMDDAAGARHANPWSGWTRLSVLPLLALAAWSGVWIGPRGAGRARAGPRLDLDEPRLFPPPASTGAWMSRGVAGERIWLAAAPGGPLEHHRPVLRVLAGAGLAGTALLLAGMAFLDPAMAFTGLAVTMPGKLRAFDRMGWIEAGHRREQ